MDLLPPHLHIRGADLGALLRLRAPMIFYRYLSTAVPSHGPFIAGAAGVLVPPVFLATHRYLSQLEALQSLALPGPLPTHVMEFEVPMGTQVQGPAYVEPLSYANVWALPDVHRLGNGVELTALTPLHLAAGTYTVYPL
jgi:hypothetical protein